MKIGCNTNFTLPKQTQRCRSVLQDGSRSLGLFWKKKKLRLITEEIRYQEDERLWAMKSHLGLDRILLKLDSCHLGLDRILRQLNSCHFGLDNISAA